MHIQVVFVQADTKSCLPGNHSEAVGGERPRTGRGSSERSNAKHGGESKGHSDARDSGGSSWQTTQ